MLVLLVNDLTGMDPWYEQLGELQLVTSKTGQLLMKNMKVKFQHITFPVPDKKENVLTNQIRKAQLKEPRQKPL